jgi:hypothetical protein
MLLQFCSDDCLHDRSVGQESADFETGLLMEPVWPDRQDGPGRGPSGSQSDVRDHTRRADREPVVPVARCVLRARSRTSGRQSSGSPRRRATIRRHAGSARRSPGRPPAPTPVCRQDSNAGRDRPISFHEIRSYPSLRDVLLRAACAGCSGFNTYTIRLRPESACRSYRSSCVDRRIFAAIDIPGQGS